MIKFLKAQGSGWWLHNLGAIAIMAVAWYLMPFYVNFGPLTLSSMQLGLILNTGYWPVRELWQKIGYGHPVKDFFTFHVTLEWACPVFLGIVFMIVRILIGGT